MWLTNDLREEGYISEYLAVTPTRAYVPDSLALLISANLWLLNTSRRVTLSITRGRSNADASPSVGLFTRNS
jgi:hypothetical protein